MLCCNPEAAFGVDRTTGVSVGWVVEPVIGTPPVNCGEQAAATTNNIMAVKNGDRNRFIFLISSEAGTKL